jgi:S1-C subfamily serine protease
VTFDFPRNRLYWKHGQHFGDRDNRLVLADVEIERDKEAVTIRDVDPYGRAGRLGLHRGDILETLNGRDARRFSNWHIRRILAREHGSLSALVRRGSEKLTLQSEAASDDEKK